MTASPTTNEIAALERTPDAGVALPTVTGGSMPGLEIVEQWASAVATVERFVGPLVDTSFVPVAHWPLPLGVTLKDFPNPRRRHPRESPEEWQWRRQVAAASATGAVMKGLPLGLDPYTALDQVFIVHGRPGLYVKLKWAMVVSKGHELWVENPSDESVTVCGRRKGWPQDRVEQRTITIDDARRAGWTRNEAYEKTPRDMLENRAASRVIDKIAGDVVFGLPSVEDLLDTPDPDAAAEPSARMTTEQIVGDALEQGSARNALASVLEHAERAPAEGAAETVVTPDGRDEPARKMKPAQWKAINTRLHELGVDDPDVRLDVIGLGIVGRPITKGSDLNEQEAAFVLDNLTGDAGATVLAMWRKAQDVDEPPPQQTQALTARPGEDDHGHPAPDPWGINDEPDADGDELPVPGDDS